MDVFDLFAKITLDTKGYDDGLSKAKSKLSAFGGAMGSAFGTVAKVGAAALTAATGAAVALGTSAVAAGYDFDKSMSQVAATLGKTTDEITDLRDFAQEMGRTTAFSATQAADALNYMALAGYDSEKSMKMLPNVLNLAAAGNMDLARASDMVTDTQTAFGLSIERTSQMVDEMAKAASTGNTSVEQLGDAFLVVGGLAKELNGGMITLADGTQAPVDGIQEMEIALTAMANAGVKGSEAGTHMRNMLLKLASPTAEGTKALEAMGVKVFDAEGKMRSLSDVFGDLNGKLGEMTQEKKIQTISKLFNTRDMAAAEAMLAAIGSDWDNIGESILDAQGAASQMADTQLDNLAGDVTLFKSALEGAQIAISDTLTPALRDFVKFGTDGLSTLTGAFKEGGLSGAVTAFGSILSEGITLIIAKIPEFIQAGIQLLSALGEGFAQNVDVILGAIEQVVTIILDTLGSGAEKEGDSAVVKFLSGLANIFINNLDKIVEIATNITMSLINGLTTHAGDIVKGAKDIVLKLAEGLTKAAPELIPAAVEMIIEFSEALLENPEELFSAAYELVHGIVTGLVKAVPILAKEAPILVSYLVEAIVKAIPLIIEVGGELIAGLVVGLIDGIGALWEGLGRVGQAIVDAICDFFGIHSPSTVFAEIGTFLIEGLIQGITDMIGDAVAAIGELGSAVIEGITGFFSDAWTQAKELASEAWGAIKDTATEAWGKIEEGAGKLRDNIGAFFDTAKTNAVNAWNDAKSKFSTVWSNVQSAFSTAGSWFQTTFTTAKNWAVGAWNDIKPKFTAKWNELKQAFNEGKAGDWFKKEFENAKDLAVKAWDDVKSKFGKVWENVKNAFNLDDALNWGKDLVSNFIGGIKAKAADLKEELKGVADKVKAFLGFSEPEEGPLSDFHTYAPDMMELFAKGIRDNTDIVTDQIKKSFDFGNMITAEGAMSTGGFNAGGVTINVYARDGQSARSIVDEIDYRIAKKTEAKKAVWGMS